MTCMRPCCCCAGLAVCATEACHIGAHPQAARSSEMQFFNTSPAYAGCQNIGTDFLSNKLSTQLVRAIQQQLPVITSSIDNGCAVLLIGSGKYLRCRLLASQRAGDAPGSSWRGLIFQLACNSIFESRDTLHCVFVTM